MQHLPSYIQAAEDMILTWDVVSMNVIHAFDQLRITLRCTKDGRNEGQRPADVFSAECPNIDALIPINPALFDEQAPPNQSLHWQGINMLYVSFQGDDRTFAFSHTSQSLEKFGGGKRLMALDPSSSHKRSHSHSQSLVIETTSRSLDDANLLSTATRTQAAPAPPPPPPPHRRHKRSSSHQGSLTESQQLSRWMLDEGSIVQPIRSSEDEPIEIEAEQLMMTHRGAALDALMHASSDLDTASLPLSLIMPSAASAGSSGGSTEPQMKQVLGLLFGDRMLKPIHTRTSAPGSTRPPLPPHSSASPVASSSRLNSITDGKSKRVGVVLRRPSSTSLNSSPLAFVSSQLDRPSNNSNLYLHTLNSNFQRSQAKLRDLNQVAPDLRRLEAIVTRLRAAEDFHSQAKSKLGSLLAEQASKHSSITQPIQLLTKSLSDLCTRNINLSATVAELIASNDAIKAQMRSRVDSLIEGSLRLGTEVKRRGEAEASLSGPEGLGRWRALLSQVVARRCQMVSTLASMYELGPSPTSGRLGAFIPPLDGEALEKNLDVGWGGVASGSLTSSSSNRAGSFANRSSPLPPHPHPPPAHASTSGPRGSKRPPPPQLSILGLTLPDQLVKRVLTGQEEGSTSLLLSFGGGGGGLFDEEQRIAAALGYLAHLVDRISFILDVQLRYPLIPCMSGSRLIDHAPLIELQEALHGSSAGFLTRGLTRLFSSSSPSPSSSAQLISNVNDARQLLSGPRSIGRCMGGETILELPLFLDDSNGAGLVEQRNRMALAAHLLNKNVEVLLQAHGLTPASSNVLQNLFLLVCASRTMLSNTRCNRAVTTTQISNKPTPLIRAMTSHHSPSNLHAIRLYTNPGSRGKICEWVLSELDLPHEAVVVNMRAGEHKQPSFLAINPFGKVPAMEDGDLKLFESGAILLHLASKYGKLDENSTSRLAVWSLFANSTMASAFFSPSGRNQMAEILRVLDTLLSKSSHIEGNEFSLSDVAVGSYLLYLPLFYPDMFPSFCKEYPKVWSYMLDLASRPKCPDSYKEGLRSVNPDPAGGSSPTFLSNLFGKKN